ncbi:P-loop containing nucleoside triphosphate hydrolase protein, partial [Pavlovales sp. CCMP2436]
PSLINLQMELRKCCNHPFLIKGVEEGETHDLTRPEYLERLVYASGKYVLLDKLLPRLRADGHKVLIFSQMVRMLDMMEDFMRDRQYSFERLDGTIRGDARQMAIDRFSTTDTFVFLLSTRAGGLGINLTAADTCIILDSDWNPQNDIQAMARSHRIGQKKTVFRLVTRNTYESQMVERANKKLGLERALNADRANGNVCRQQVSIIFRAHPYTRVLCRQKIIIITLCTVRLLIPDRIN